MYGNNYSMFLINPFIYGGGGGGYLADDYTTSVAYSLRNVSSTTTNVVRIRRDSDNAEIDVSASDITDGTLTTWTGANNGYVTTWYDQSGNANNLTQTTASNQPLLVSVGVVQTTGGTPSVEFGFDTAADYLTTTTSILNQVSTSAFGVGTLYNNITTGCLFCASPTTYKSQIMYLDKSGSKLSLRITNTSATNFDALMSIQRVAGNTNRLLTAFVDASKNMSEFDNSATGGTATYTGSFTSDGLWMGYVPGGFSKLIGSISELIIMNTDESSNRTDIETNINDFYSIY